MDSIALTLYQLLHGAKDDVRWITDVYPATFTVLVFLPLIIATLYYFVFVAIGPVFRKVIAWVLTLIITGLLTATITYFMARNYLKDIPFDEEFVSFWGINFLYALILFFTYSMGLKFISIHAKKTPF